MSANSNKHVLTIILYLTCAYMIHMPIMFKPKSVFRPIWVK